LPATVVTGDLETAAKGLYTVFANLTQFNNALTNPSGVLNYALFQLGHALQKLQITIIRKI